MNGVRPLPPQRSRWLTLLVVVLGTMALMRLLSHAVAPWHRHLTYSELYQLLQDNARTQEIEEARLIEDRLEGRFKNGTGFSAYVPLRDEQILTLLRQQVGRFDVQPPQAGLFGLLMAFSPWLVFLGLMWLMMRSTQGAGGKNLLTFGKSRARLISPETQTRVTFDDVAGIEEAKEELREIIEFLKDPKRFQRLGGKIPKGVLLIGLPGTGKTLLAKAVAGEAAVPFYSISGSDFVEMFVGVGASVPGDTPVLIRDAQGTRLVPIAQFVDPLYQSAEQEGIVPTPGVMTLGFEPTEGRGFGSNQRRFGHSAWQPVRGASRHRVDHLYEIRYLGGVIRATGDHSIFVRRHGGIASKAVRDLQPGDVLVGLPYKTRLEFLEGHRTEHVVRSHRFAQTLPPACDLVPALGRAAQAYQFVMAQRDVQPQRELADTVGVSQATIGHWQRGIHQPRVFSYRSWDHGLPEHVTMTPALMKLLGFYTAEGRFSGSFVEFVFGAHESVLHEECIGLMREAFHLEPSVTSTPDHTLRITYHSTPLGEWFAKQCGNGSHHKHVPELLWDLSSEHFQAYLEGVALGDGYATREGKLSVTSVSQQLVRELAWLCARHGIGVGIRHGFQQGGRIIKDKPLPDGEYWNLIIGRTSHPFLPITPLPHQGKRLRVLSVVKQPYEGYVYDLCGCGQEAFFGGEKPVLLHNSRVRDLFDQARRNARQGGKGAIIFIDEIDAVGRQRFAGIGGGHDEREQTLNALLVEMDGFDTQEGTILMAATNRPDVLDPALLRPGRFDRRVIISLPDLVGREAILMVHTRKIKLDPAVDLKSIARQTPGFSGADLANLANEAALLAARLNKHGVGSPELEQAIERVIAGPERKSRILNEREKRVTAFHESGHALVALMIPDTDPLHKVSIIPRGAHALGYTMQLPIEDRYTMSRNELVARITVMMGGRAAEELVFGEITTGAQNDLETATELARRMVCEFGMSERLGNLTYGRRERQMFLGRDLFEERNYSEQTAVLIDEEIRKVVDACYERARGVLKDHREQLDRLATTLLEREVLDGEDVKRLVGVSAASATSTPDGSAAVSKTA